MLVVLGVALMGGRVAALVVGVGAVSLGMRNIPASSLQTCRLAGSTVLGHEVGTKGFPGALGSALCSDVSGENR